MLHMPAVCLISACVTSDNKVVNVNSYGMVGTQVVKCSTDAQGNYQLAAIADSGSISSEKNKIEFSHLSGAMHTRWYSVQSWHYMEQHGE
jgi:hypothetical protein